MLYRNSLPPYCKYSYIHYGQYEKLFTGYIYKVWLSASPVVPCTNIKENPGK